MVILASSLEGSPPQAQAEIIHEIPFNIYRKNVLNEEWNFVVRVCAKVRGFARNPQL